MRERPRRSCRGGRNVDHERVAFSAMRKASFGVRLVATGQPALVRGRDDVRTAAEGGRKEVAIAHRAHELTRKRGVLVADAIIPEKELSSGAFRVAERSLRKRGRDEHELQPLAKDHVQRVREIQCALSGKAH